MLTSIAAAENLWILLKHETKLWLREATIVIVSNRIEHRHRVPGYASHDALLQAIHTRCHMLNRSSRDSRRY